MKPYLDINLNIIEPYRTDLDLFFNKIGYEIGLATNNGNWDKMSRSDDKILRIVKPPVVDGYRLSLELSEYEWKNLVSFRQFQGNTLNAVDNMSYIMNAVVLTANAIVYTNDHKLVFHYKNGGAKYDSIHAFGGYVHKKDIEAGGLEKAIIRELSEPDELGLDATKIQVQGLFGNQNSMPSIIWSWGTAAIYGIAKVDYSSTELWEQLPKINGKETTSKGLYVVKPNDLSKLARHRDLHPQTQQVMKILEEIYDD